MTATTTTTPLIACGNRVHGRAPGVQHHHYGVAKVRECFAAPHGIPSVEEGEEIGSEQYDPDAAYEAHLENSGYWAAREDEDREAAMGVVSFEEARQAAEQKTLPLEGKVDFTGIPDGTYTVYLDQYGQHRTFKVKTQRPDASFAPGQRTLSILVGPDNEGDYVGVGFVSTDARGIHHLRTWKKYDAIGIVGQEAAQTLLNDPREALVAGRCYRCQRLLTTPESLSMGIGPECARQVGL